MISHEQFIKEKFNDVKFIKDNHYMALCPCHADSNPSLRITYRPEKNNLIMYCFVCRCSFNDVCNALGLRESDFWFDNHIKNDNTIFFPKYKNKEDKIFTGNKVSLEEYADTKKLPIKYLKNKWGCKNDKYDGRDSIIFPYNDMECNFIRDRHRIDMTGKNKFVWGYEKENWNGIPLYGLDKINLKSRSVIIVEGESDTQTLHYLGFNVLGLPSATVYSDKLHYKTISHYKHIYIYIEKDTGGKTFKKIFEKSKLKNMVTYIGMDKYKDFSELFIDNSNSKKKCVKLVKQVIKRKDIKRKESSSLNGLNKDDEKPFIDIDLNVERGFLDFTEIPKGNPLGDMIKSVSIYNETPYALAFGLGLSVISACVRGKLQIENTNGFREPLVIWTISALETGERKSPVFNCMINEILNWEYEQEKANKVKIKKSESKRKKILAQIKKLENNTLSADDKENNNDIEELHKKIKDIKVLPKIICRDITNQRISQEIVKQGGSISIFSDEGEIFKNVRGNFSNQDANYDVFLSGYSGGKIDVLRASNDISDISIRHGHLTLGLAVQPFVISKLMNDKEFKESGFLARFLFLNPINKTLKKKENTKPISLTVGKAYRYMVKNILNQTIMDKDEKGNERPFVLKLSKDAGVLIKNFHNMVEDEKVKYGSPLNNIIGWANKLKGNVLRIAGLLHISIHPITPWVQEVSRETMALSIKYGYEFKKHAVYSFGCVELDNDLEKAKKIIDWMIKKKIESFSARDIIRSVRKEFQKILDTEEPLNILEERYYIKRDIGGIVDGRSRVKYIVNPLFMEKKY